MNRWLCALAILAVVVATVTAYGWLAHVSSRGGETAPLHSMRRFDPYGLAALARLLEHRGHQVISLQRPRLDRAHHGTLIQTLTLHQDAGLDDSPYRLPVDQLLQWVAQGNTLIHLSRRPTTLMKELGIDMAYDDLLAMEELEASQRQGVFPDQLHDDPTPARWQAASPAGLGGSILLRSPNAFTWDEEDQGEDQQQDQGKARPAGLSWPPVALAHREDDPSAVVACEIRHGQGRVILIASPSIATNQDLAERDNLETLLGLIPPDRPVLFDEWAHGVGHAGTVMDVIVRFGLLPLVAQIALGILMYRWSTAGLTSRPADDAPRRRSSHEQIHTLGHLYDQAWDLPERVRRVHDEVTHRFAQACRCDPSQVLPRLQARQTPAGQAAARLIMRLQGAAATFRPVCRRCGYDLTASSGDRCPECGQWLPRELRRLARRSDLQAVPDESHRITQRELARMLTQSHHLSRELSIG